MLDNVIDINYYAVPQARNSNLKHRPVGMGIMGFQDALYEMGMAYGSDAAVEFADESMEMISTTQFRLQVTLLLNAVRRKHSKVLYGIKVFCQSTLLT